jgi:hypothetical protein
MLSIVINHEDGPKQVSKNEYKYLINYVLQPSGINNGKKRPVMPAGSFAVALRKNTPFLRS